MNIIKENIMSLGFVIKIYVIYFLLRQQVFVFARVQLSVMTDCQLSNRTSQLETLDKIFKNNYLKALENEQNRGYTMIPLT